MNSFNPLIRWGYVQGKCRGVFANQNVSIGALIERSPVIVFPMQEMSKADGTKLHLENYCFLWKDKEGVPQYAIGLGYISLYNHSLTPNATFACDYNSKEMTLTAISEIKAGDEITFDYDCELWFIPR